MPLNLNNILENLPEVAKPKTKLSLKDKLMWTGVVLVIYFILSMIPLYGLSSAYQSRFESLAVLLAAQFGSIITLGIGPIVTGSIILELLIGADIIKLDMNTPEGKKLFQGLQKIFSVFFIVFENGMFVLSGALPPAVPGIAATTLMIIQLVIGGVLLMLLDEVSSKWGIGSGISLFIAAGVAREIFVAGLNPFPLSDPAGALPKILAALRAGLPENIIWPLVSIVSTILIFALGAYFQSIRVEIPLSFSRVRGYNIRWPINFFYTSNIPVILTAAMIAGMQFWGLMLFNAGVPILGTYQKEYTGSGYQEVAISGLVKYIQPPSLSQIVYYGMTKDYMTSIVVYLVMMLVGAVVFSLLWVNVGGQGPSNVAGQILSSGLSMPGFRQDERILERILSRYIIPLTIMGGVVVAILAVGADLLGALSRGTGILLTVMIIYNFYQNIMKQHAEDVQPLLGKVFGGSA